MSEVRERLARFFGKRGARVVDANLAVIREAYDAVVEVTAALSSESEIPSVEVVV